MNTTTNFLKKSGQMVVIAAACVQFSQCDSNTPLISGSNESNFEPLARFDAVALEANPGDVIAFPASLLAGEQVKFAGFIEEEDNIDTVVRSSGQIFSGNFRFNYSNRAAGNRDVENTETNEAVILRSTDHSIDDGGALEAALADMQSSSGGIGSLRQALLVDQTVTDAALVPFTNDEVIVILNAIRSLGHTAKIEEGTLFFIVLADHQYRLTATSTNQQLLDENKIVGTVEQTKFWRSLSFEYDADKDGNPTGTEYTIKVSEFSAPVVEVGTFEIQLNSL